MTLGGFGGTLYGRRLGGGENDASLHLILLGVVILMIAVPSVILSVSDDVHAEVYLEATSGSGTIDDPYSGEVTCNGTWFWNKFNHEIWVEIGTSFDITVRSGAWGGESITVTPGFGLEISTGNSDLLIGTANNVGQCIVTYSDNTEYTLTINIVEPFEPLVFLSNPVSDGTVVFARFDRRP